MVESGPINRDPGQWVANPSPIEQFTQAYATAGRILSSIWGNAPSSTDHNTNALVDPCLSYHLRGGGGGGATQTANGPQHIGPFRHQSDA